MKSQERLAEILLHLKVTANKLSKEIGHSSNVKIQHIKSGRNDISEEVAKEIIERYPEFEYRWLIKGEGRMLKDNGEYSKGKPYKIDEKELLLVKERLSLYEERIDFYKEKIEMLEEENQLLKKDKKQIIPGERISTSK